MVLAGGGDGQSLRWQLGHWLDPFAEPLSDENRAFVVLSGKWEAVDVAEWPGYSRIIGQPITSVEAITPGSGLTDAVFRAEPDLVMGARIVTPGGRLDAFSNGWDEFEVIVSPAD